jgi:hypothetical protein
MDAFASVAFAVETRVSLAGPASAGAIVVAVSAAQISNAERKEANSPAVEMR